MSLLKNAELSDEDIDTVTAQEIDDKKLEDDITIPGSTYDVSEKYYDLTRYVNDVNTENIEVLQEYTQSGSLKSSHIYGNERIYSDIYDPVTEAFNVSNYNYDGRGSVVQTVTGTDVTSQLSYDPFGNLTMGEPEGALIQQAQSAQAVLGQIQTALELLLQLIGANDEMTLRDRELTHSDKTVHLARVLVSEKR